MRTRNTQFPAVFEQLVDKIGQGEAGPIRVPCKSEGEAHSWRGQFNNWRKLKRAQEPGDASLLDSIIVKVEGQVLVFMNRDQTEIAQKIADLLK